MKALQPSSINIFGMALQTLKGFSQMKKKFSVSQKQGIIKPIEKKGKDKR